MNLVSKKFNELTNSELYEILKSRAEIFIMEQNIHYQDIDDVDYNALHCFFIEQDRVVAYLRAFYNDESKETVQVGRVLTLVHGNGVGKDLIKKSIIAINKKMKCKKICMDAQKHAVGFYEKLGFKITSKEFLEEGVVHQKMELVF